GSIVRRAAGRFGRLVQFQRAGVQLVVGAVLGDQLVVGAALDDAAMVQNHDGIGVLHGGQAVGDDKGGAAGHQRVHAAVDNGLGVGVDGGGRLVHDHDRRVGHGRAGNGQQLALALAQVGAVAGQHGVVAVGQAADKVVRAGQLGGGDALLVMGVQVAVADVFHHGAGEQVGVLQDDAQRMEQVSLRSEERRVGREGVTPMTDYRLL